MKCFRILPCVILLSAILPACERKAASPRPPQPSDTESYPPLLLDEKAEPDLLADQAAISRRIERERGLPPADGSSIEAAANPLEQVKQKLTEVLTAVKAGQNQSVLMLLEDRDAAVMRPILQAEAELEQKVQIFEALCLNQLGMAVPPELQSIMEAKTSQLGLGVGLDFKNISIDALQFAVDGTNVVVTDPLGQTFLFAPVNGQYKMRIPPEALVIPPVVRELAAAQNRFVDQMISEIRNGRITEENFDARINEVAEKIVMPTLKKFMELQFSDMPTEPTSPPSAAPNTESEETSRGGGLRGRLRTITQPLERKSE